MEEGGAVTRICYAGEGVMFLNVLGFGVGSPVIGVEPLGLGRDVGFEPTTFGTTNRRSAN
jgi:hypothetical protein